MKLNQLVKTDKKKIRVGRGIGSGKEKHLAEVTRDKNLEEELQLKAMRVVKCLYMKTSKRGFKSINKEKIAILNLSNLQNFYDKKRIDFKNLIDLKQLKKIKIINKKYSKLKILGSGEVKNKIDISANYFSDQAKKKIEKLGGKLTVVKN